MKMFHVIKFDIGDDGDIRRVKRERAITFIGFNHRVGPLPCIRYAAESFNLAANRKGGRVT